MIARCYLCSGELERRSVTAENWSGDELALVEEVPALVCVNCGEPVFDAETCQQLDALRHTEPTRTVQVPVYAFCRR